MLGLIALGRCAVPECWTDGRGPHLAALKDTKVSDTGEGIVSEKVLERMLVTDFSSSSKDVVQSAPCSALDMMVTRDIEPGSESAWPGGARSQ